MASLGARIGECDVRTDVRSEVSEAHTHGLMWGMCARAPVPKSHTFVAIAETGHSTGMHSKRGDQAELFPLDGSRSSASRCTTKEPRASTHTYATTPSSQGRSRSCVLLCRSPCSV